MGRSEESLRSTPPPLRSALPIIFYYWIALGVDNDTSLLNSVLHS